MSLGKRIGAGILSAGLMMQMISGAFTASAAFVTATSPEDGTKEALSDDFMGVVFEREKVSAIDGTDVTDVFRMNYYAYNVNGGGTKFYLKFDPTLVTPFDTEALVPLSEADYADSAYLAMRGAIYTVGDKEVDITDSKKGCMMYVTQEIENAADGSPMKSVSVEQGPSTNVTKNGASFGWSANRFPLTKSGNGYWLGSVYFQLNEGVKLSQVARTAFGTDGSNKATPSGVCISQGADLSANHIYFTGFPTPAVAPTNVTATPASSQVVAGESTDVTVSADAPTDGGTLSFAVYKATGSGATTGGTAVTAFAPGPKLSFKPEADAHYYVVARNTKTQDGEESTADTAANTTFTYSVATAITAVSVGMTAPEEGAALKDATVDGAAAYTVSTVWDPDHATAQKLQDYTATVTLSAKADHLFTAAAADSITITGATGRQVSEAAVSEGGKKLTFKVVFRSGEPTYVSGTAAGGQHTYQGILTGTLKDTDLVPAKLAENLLVTAAGDGSGENLAEHGTWQFKNQNANLVAGAMPVELVWTPDGQIDGKDYLPAETQATVLVKKELTASDVEPVDADKAYDSTAALPDTAKLIVNADGKVGENELTFMISGQYCVSGVDSTANTDAATSKHFVVTGATDKDETLKNSVYYVMPSDLSTFIVGGAKIEKATPVLALGNLSQTVGSVGEVTVTTTPASTLEADKKGIVIEYELSKTKDAGAETEWLTWDAKTTADAAKTAGDLIKAAAAGTKFNVRTYIPAATTNFNAIAEGSAVKGELTVNAKSSGGSSGGGGSSSGSTQDKTTTTATNPDGSETTTVTDKKTGTVTETTKYTDGSSKIVEMKKDGTVTQTTTAKDGVKVVAVIQDKGSVDATVTLPSSVKSAKVTIPAPKVTAGTVLVEVGVNGEQVAKKIVVTKDGVELTLDASARFKIEDRSKAFGDVSETDWAYEPVTFVTARDLFTGISDTEFGPKQPMTRGMLATVLYRLEGAQVSGAPDFSDVTAGLYYTDAVAWAAQQGIVTGIGDGRFAAEGSITREQLAAMLYRYAKASGTSGNVTGYPDAAQVSPWASEAMNWAVDAGIISGDNNGRLNPQGNATRAEVATMLMRFVKTLA